MNPLVEKWRRGATEAGSLERSGASGFHRLKPGTGHEPVCRATAAFRALFYGKRVGRW